MLVQSLSIILLYLNVIQCIPLASESQPEIRNALKLDQALVDRITEFTSNFGFINELEVVQQIERVSDALNYYLTKDIPYEDILYILLNPFKINKLSCGPYTFYEANQNPTVGLDVCLAGLVIAKVFLAAPLIRSSLQEGGIFNVLDSVALTLDRLDLGGPTVLKEGGIFNILDAISNKIERIDMAGSGPEGEPFGPEVEVKQGKPEIKEIGGVEYEVLSTVQNQDTESSQEQTKTSAEAIYQGFGFNDWSSGLKKISDLGQMLSHRQGLATADLPDFASHNDMELYDYLPRSMPGLPTARLQELLRSTIAGLKASVSVDYQN